MSNTTANPLAQKGGRELLAGYADVVNRAMQRNADKRWFRRAKQASKLLAGGSRFKTLVYDGDSDNVVAEAILHFDADRETVRVVEGKSGRVTFSWKVSTAYLRDVVDNRPDWYIDNPLQLDWKWLSDRAATEWRHRDTEPVAMGFLLGLVFAGIMSLLRPRDRYR